jgi:hypothetical protein
MPSLYILTVFILFPCRVPILQAVILGLSQTMEHFYHTFIRMGGNHAQQLVCLLPYPHGLMWFCIHVDIVAFIVQASKGDGSLSSRLLERGGTSRSRY